MLQGRFAGALAGALALFSISAIAQQVSLPGQFSVSGSGAATYSIPIQTPAGVSGVEPKLSIGYNSQSGPGLLGVGWNVSGLSSIIRCPKTVAQDGAAAAIAFNVTDRYCLDGQRLAAVTGTYGAAGTEYRVEIDTFSKIVSNAETGAAGGPGSFVVQTKSGLTMEYGKTADSRIELQGRSEVAVWALNKVTDSKGNYLTIAYNEDNANGQYYPARIDYTGNAGSTPVLSPQTTVFFDYAPRPDIYPKYIATNLSATGSLVRNSVMLTKIRVVNAGSSTPTVYYQFNYGFADSTLRMLLLGVTQCGTTCLPAKTFDYTSQSFQVGSWSQGGQSGVGNDWDFANIFGDGQNVYWTHNDAGQFFATRLNANQTMDHWTWSGGAGPGSKGWRMVDLFGDGRQVYWTTNGSGPHYATRLNPDGTLQNWTWSSGIGMAEAYDFADLFGDGRMELVSHDKAGNFFAMRMNADGISQTWTWRGGNGLGSIGFKFLDLFGDGRAVYWTSNGSGQHYVTRLNADGTFQNMTFTGGGVADSWDFNNLFGDGRNLYVTRNNAGQVWATAMYADGTSRNWSWTTGIPANGYGWKFVDLFGDGRQEYWTTLGGGTHKGARFNPDGTFNTWTWTGGAGVGETYDFADLFGDGRNVYWTHLPNGQHFMTRLNADGTQTTFNWAGQGLGNQGWRLVDLWGDGRKVYWSHNGDGTHFVTRFTAGNPSLLSTVTDGLGSVLKVYTSRLTELLINGSGRYIKDQSPSYPRVFFTAEAPVVTDVDASDGVGGLRRTSYTYGTALAELGTGRGYLGFSWTQTQDVSTGLVTRTYFRQDFPYLGLVDKSGKGTNAANWSNLELTTNAYACVQPNPSLQPGQQPACTVQPGNRYFVYSSSQQTRAADLNGTALPGSLVTNGMVDGYGNIGTVATQLLNPDGSYSDYAKSVTNTYFNDATRWYLGRLTKSVVTATGPNVPAPVTPAAGGLPPVTPGAPTQQPPLTPEQIMLILSDD